MGISSLHRSFSIFDFAHFPVLHFSTADGASPPFSKIAKISRMCLPRNIVISIPFTSEKVLIFARFKSFFMHPKLFLPLLSKLQSAHPQKLRGRYCLYCFRPIRIFYLTPFSLCRKYRSSSGPYLYLVYLNFFIL